MKNSATRLVNLSKNEVGGIKKHMLYQIKANLVSKLGINEWKTLKM